MHNHSHKPLSSENSYSSLHRRKFKMTQCLFRLAMLCFLLRCSHGQCDELSTEECVDRASIHRCFQMYKIFEEALTGNEDNLYTLREAFLSTEHSSPSLLTINYHLVNEWNNKTYESMVSIPWSRSSIFEYVNPNIFFAIEPAVVLGTFEQVGATILPRNNIIELSLPINTNSIPRNINSREVQHTLYTITARIRAYAVTQGKLPPGWDGSNNGYVLHLERDITKPLIFFTGITTMLLVFSLLLSPFAVKNVSTAIQSTQHRFYSMAVLYSIGIVTTVPNSLELIFSIKTVGTLAKASQNSSAGILPVHALILALTKGVFISTGLMVATLCAIYGWRIAHSSPLFSRIFNYSKVVQKLIHSVIFLSVSHFVFLLVTSICPVFLLIFVYPVRVISSLMCIGTLLFCMVTTIRFICFV